MDCDASLVERVVPDRSRALSFGVVAADYHRLRPRTPAQMLDWLLPPDARDAVDLAAGTGAQTALLAARGLHVTAVEPDPGMREVLAGAAPDAEVLAGTAEAIPLHDAGTDVLVVASAWHWFEPAKAVPEIARVLRDDGRLAVVGNGMDPRVDWVRQLRERSGASPRGDCYRRDVVLPAGAPFEAPETFEVTWLASMAANDLLALLETFSRVIVASATDRSRLRERAYEVLEQFPQTAGRTGGDLVEVPMRSWGWRATRRPRGDI